MRKGKFIYATIYLTLLFALTGCGGKMGISARDDGKADISVLMDTGKAASRMIASIMASLYPSSAPEGGVFSPERAAALQKSLSGGDAEQLAAESLSPSVLSLSATLKEAAAQAAPARPGLSLSSVVAVEARSLTLTLSPRTMKALYESMDGQSQGYMDLFMAPAFTGERMTGEEYTALIASVYGKDMAEEIAGAQMELSLSAPKGQKVASCSQERAKVSGRKAVLSIPLLDLLVMDGERSYRIDW